MYPNQQPDQVPTPPPNPYAPQPPAPAGLPVDYLNQIAPQAPKKALFTFGIKQVGLIGGALVILVIIISVIATHAGGGKKEPLEHLSLRLTATQDIVTAAQPNLKSSELRSLNSNLNLYMTNTNRDIAKQVTAAGITTKSISKNVVTSESTTALKARLEDARLNAVYDRTYAREMAYQLGTLLTLIKENYKSANSASLKTFLESAYDNLEPTEESFANFTAAD